MKRTEQAAPTLFPEKRAEETQVEVVNSPAEIIKQAISGGSDLEKLEKLLALNERWEGNEAKKAFNKAMTAFKANPPVIEKDKKVAFGNTKYNHASLANVTQKINEGLSKHGLSASWMISQNGQIAVTCRITHERGHSEETTLAAPADKSGAKNEIQSIGSTISYLERYTLLALTGLATQEMDTDGVVEAEKITPEDVADITLQLTNVGASLDKFLVYMGIKKIEDMPKADLQRAKMAIESAKAKKAATTK